MVTKLTRAEAFGLLAEGKKIRGISWPAYMYIYMIGDYVYNEQGEVTDPDFFGDDFELYEEPTQERLATTLEECYQAKQVDILWPNKCESQYIKTRFWGDKDLAVFLAALNLPGARVVIEA